MQLKPENLSSHLARELAGVYVISGDEPLQIDEALAMVRKSARDRGFTDRVVFHVDRQFDWNVLHEHADSLSLFAQKRLLEVRMRGGKPGAGGSEALLRYVSRPSPDNVLLVSSGMLDARERQARWYRALDQAGVTVQVWPLDSRSLPRWIMERMRRSALRATEEAAATLAERVEGNLLACAQEIKKLELLGATGEIDVQDVLRCVADSARFNPFDLVDSTLAGDAPRTARILHGLREEGVEPLPVLGTLAWEVRSLARIAADAARGARLEQVLNKHRAWARRRAGIERALRRHPGPSWLDMLRVAEDTDRVCKGMRRSDPWDAIERFALMICGVMIVSPSTYNSPGTASR